MIRQLFDSNIQFQLKDGSINVGGYLNVYFNVGTVKAVTYKDADALTVNQFDIELDNNGRAVVYADNAYVYRMEVFDRNKNLLWTQNNISLDSGIAIDGTYVMSIMGDQFIAVDSSTSGNAVTYELSLNDYAVDSINLVNDNTFGNSALYNSIQSTSAHLNNKIDNLDIHNISIEQSGDGNAYTSFTKNGDVYTFNKDATYLPSANAPVVSAGENVEVSSSNINGQMQYTIKANPAGNVTNLISTDDSISISATSVGNDVTYDLSVGSLSGKANYALLSVSGYPLTANHFGGVVFDNYTTKGMTWSTIDTRLEIPNTIELIDVNVECELLLSNINNVTYDNLLLGIYQDWGLLEEKKFEIDLSKERHFVTFTTKMLDVENLQFTIKSPANGTANIRVSVNDETVKSIAGGGGSTDIELYSSDGSLLISGDGSAYDLKLNEQLSAKNYFVPNITGYDFQIPFGLQANEYFGWHSPRSTDLTCYRDVSGTQPWEQDDFANLMSIKIPKEMKLFELGAEFEINTTTTSAVNYKLDISIYLDDVVVCEYKDIHDMLNGPENINFNKLIYNPFDHDALMTFKSNSEFPMNWRRLCINDETYRSIGTTGQGIPDNYDSLYSTVSSNSATWNENGGTSYSAGPNINITDNVISGRDWTPELNTKLDTTAFTPPTAGNGISITNSEISVNAGKGLGFDVNKKLEVKVGNGLAYDSENKVITINNEVGDVVESVNKLEEDLDTKLTVNFNMASITHTYDFADSSVTTLTDGATMLCQAFTVPINCNIRLATNDEDPTLIGIYSKQSYSNKIMLGLYVYDFNTGYTEYVADTGPVTVAAGRNEFPIKHINDNITELKSNCVYYVALYLPSSHGAGLYLASCQSYSNASYMNATPRFTVGVQNIIYNGSEISLASDETGRLDYNDGLGNYYIGPWSDGYNERPNAPRFFMQLRNGKAEEPVVVEPFDNISSYTVSAKAINSLFTNASELGAASMPVVYREVTPLRDITINWWQSWSPLSSDDNKFGAIIYSTGFNNIIYDKANVTVTDQGQSDGLYARKYTPNSSITLLAGTTYRFPVWLGNSNYTDNCITYDTPATSTVLHLFHSAWSINEWASYKRLNDVAAMPLILHDTDDNTYRI